MNKVLSTKVFDKRQLKLYNEINGTNNDAMVLVIGIDPEGKKCFLRIPVPKEFSYYQKIKLASRMFERTDFKKLNLK